jgi:hypothetical protein
MNNKPKAIVQEIIFTHEQQQEVKDILDGKPSKESIERQQNRGINIENWLRYIRPVSLSRRREILKKKYFKGLCIICGSWPSWKVSYPFGGITLVQYYCEKHKEQIPK